MSRHAVEAKRRRHSARFGAPWGRKVKLTTSASMVLLVAVMALPALIPANQCETWWARLTVTAVVTIVFTVTALFCVRGFTINRGELQIQRLLWQTRVSLDDLTAAYADPAAMQRSWRTMGNGGLMVFAGWFRNKKLGAYRAFVTDPSRCVVMEFGSRKIVVSPEDPDGFVKALGFDGDPERSTR